MHLSGQQERVAHNDGVIDHPVLGHIAAHALHAAERNPFRIGKRLRRYQGRDIRLQRQAHRQWHGAVVLGGCECAANVGDTPVAEQIPVARRVAGNDAAGVGFEADVEDIAAEPWTRRDDDLRTADRSIHSWPQAAPGQEEQSHCRSEEAPHARTLPRRAGRPEWGPPRRGSGRRPLLTSDAPPTGQASRTPGDRGMPSSAFP